MVKESLPTIRLGRNKLLLFLLFIYETLKGFIFFFIPDSLRYLNKRNDFKNSIILITGGGSGIGQLMTIKFLKLQAKKVIIWDIDRNGMEKTKSLAKKQKDIDNVDNRLLMYQVDVSDSNKINEMAKIVKKDLNGIGYVDVLVNNAGVVSGKFLLDIPDDRIKLTFNVNSLAHFFTIKNFLPDMIENKQGHIVTVASIAGTTVGTRVTDYCASKFANVGMHEALELELAQANLSNYIRTTLVRPYLINTGMFDGTDDWLNLTLEPDFVASKIVESVQFGKYNLILPWIFDYLLTLFKLLPDRAYMIALEFVGGMNAMMTFHGRQQQSTTNNKMEINNNINNNNNSVEKKEI